MTKHTLNLIIINLILTRSYFIIILSLQYYQQILCHLSIDRVVFDLEKVFSLPTINQNWWEWSPAYISCRDRVLELTGVHRCDCVIQSAPLPPPATTELSHITDYSKQTLSSLQSVQMYKRANSQEAQASTASPNTTILNPYMSWLVIAEASSGS